MNKTKVRPNARWLLVALMLASYLFAEFALPGGVLRRFWGKASDDPGVRVVAEKQGNGYRVSLDALNCTDIDITLDVAPQNTRGSVQTPFTVATNGRRSLVLGSFEPADPSLPWDFRYHYRWIYGCPGGVPDGTIYELPYDTTTPRRLIQGALGSFSHQSGSANEYANDWAMPEGTLVRAARGGVVVGIRMDSTAHGVSDRFNGSANYVIIRHPDRTYGEYLHLQAHGALVRLGETVQTGQPIAHSGNTGYTSRPHLHFAVFLIHADHRRECLPVKFRTPSGATVTLEQGNEY